MTKCPNQCQVDCAQAFFTVLDTTFTVFREVLSFAVPDSPETLLNTTAHIP